MKIRKDIKSNKYGMLTVICQAEDHIQPSGKHMAMWNCVCECGAKCVVAGQSLKNGRTKSCGCLRRRKSFESHSKHGMSRTRLFHEYCSMKRRCYCESSHDYKRWGGRGIKVCNEWLTDFKAFAEWALNHGYSDDLTLDRIDVNGDYSPENCRWADAKTQANNRRSNRLILVNGVNKTIAQAAEECGISQSTLHARIFRYGWDTERALKTPVNNHY